MVGFNKRGQGILLAVMVVCAGLGTACEDKGAMARIEVAETHRQAALEALAQENFGRALAAIELASAYNPLDPSLRELLFHVQLSLTARFPKESVLRRFDEVLYLAEFMETRKPIHRAVYSTAKGHVYSEMGRFLEARKAYQRALLEGAFFTPAGMGLLRLEAVAGNGDGVRRMVERVVAAADLSEPDVFEMTEALLKQNEAKAALPFLSKFVESHPSSRGHAFMARTLTLEGRHQEAGVHFEAAARLEPTDVRGRLNFADWLLRTGQEVAANREYLEAGELGHKGEAMMRRGLTLFEKGRFASARDTFDLAYDIDKKQIRALYYEGMASQRLEDLPNAVESYEGYLKVASAQEEEVKLVESTESRLALLKKALN